MTGWDQAQKERGMADNTEFYYFTNLVPFFMTRIVKRYRRLSLRSVTYWCWWCCRWFSSFDFLSSPIIHQLSFCRPPLHPLMRNRFQIIIVLYKLYAISQYFECKQINFWYPFDFNFSYFILHGDDVEHKENKFACAAYSKNVSITKKMLHFCLSRQCTSSHCTVRSNNPCNRCNVCHPWVQRRTAKGYASIQCRAFCYSPL